MYQRPSRNATVACSRLTADDSMTRSLLVSRPIETLSFSSTSVPSGNVSQMSPAMAPFFRASVKEETSDVLPNVAA